MRLLIGDHTGQLRIAVAGALRKIGFKVDVAKTIEEFCDLASEVNYALIVLAGLPGGGRPSDLVRAMRRDGLRAPIFAISADAAVDQCVDILDAGADDCLVKPFHNQELLARIRALLRRSPRLVKRVLRIGNLEVDEVTREVHCFGRPVALRLSERRLLVNLLRGNGCVVPKEMLIRTFSESSRQGSANAIEALVSRTRKSLSAAETGIVIHTVHGIGYRVADAPPVIASLSLLL
jgi:DNA-binding response OmpR family regulator